MDGINYFFFVALMLYCVDGAIKAIKQHLKNKEKET